MVNYQQIVCNHIRALFTIPKPCLLQTGKHSYINTDLFRTFTTGNFVCETMSPAILLLKRPTAEKANFESLIGLVFNLLSVKVFDKT